MTKKPGITLERHTEIGSQLKRIHDEMIRLNTEIGNAYALSEGLLAKSRKVTSSLTFLRGSLESMAFREHGDSFNVNVYFGSRERG